MAGKDPSMPFYTNDWLSSSRVQAMTPMQELAYFRLCLFCWSSQDASLPDDDGQLMRMARWSSKGSSRVVHDSWALVRVCFTPHPDKPGFLTNERVLALWKERQEWRTKCQIGGRNSGATRSGKRTSGRSKGSSTTLASKRELKGNSSSSSSSSSSYPPLSPLGDGERERLVGLVAKRNVHQAADAVSAALARGCSPSQIECAAKATEGKALLTLLGTLTQPAADSKAKQAAESREDRRTRIVAENDAAGIPRDETNRQLLAAGLEGIAIVALSQEPDRPELAANTRAAT